MDIYTLPHLDEVALEHVLSKIEANPADGDMEALYVKVIKSGIRYGIRNLIDDGFYINVVHWYL